MPGRDLDRAADRRADDLALVLHDERREPRVVEVGLVLGARLLDRGQRQQREDRRQRLVRGERDVDPRERVDVVAGSARGA